MADPVRRFPDSWLAAGLKKVDPHRRLRTPQACLLRARGRAAHNWRANWSVCAPMTAMRHEPEDKVVFVSNYHIVSCIDVPILQTAGEFRMRGLRMH